jgi:hypothetical protein
MSDRLPPFDWDRIDKANAPGSMKRLFRKLLKLALIIFACSTFCCIRGGGLSRIAYTLEYEFVGGLIADNLIPKYPGSQLVSRQDFSYLHRGFADIIYRYRTTDSVDIVLAFMRQYFSDRVIEDMGGGNYSIEVEDNSLLSNLARPILRDTVGDYSEVEDNPLLSNSPELTIPDRGSLPRASLQIRNDVGNGAIIEIRLYYPMRFQR